MAIRSGVNVAIGIVAVRRLWAARRFPRSAACWAKEAIVVGVGAVGVVLCWRCLCLLVRVGVGFGVGDGCHTLW